MSLTEKQLKKFNNKFVRGSDDECWEWTGYKNTDGYGKFYNNGNQRLAHRITLFLHTGLYGECACHKCDNPSCVNPNHLWWDTVKGNINDRDKKGRNGNAKLTPVQVVAIRNEYDKKNKITQKFLGEKYAVSQTTIKNIILGKSWEHI